MNLTYHHAAQAYARVDAETGVASADPHRLILMLFEGAVTAIIDAKRHLASGNLSGKGESISKAILIIDDGLRASIDVEAGGALAHNLRALYSYMTRRLLVASAHNDPAMMDEVHRLLGELRNAWAKIQAGAAHQAASGRAASVRQA